MRVAQREYGKPEKTPAKLQNSDLSKYDQCISNKVKPGRQGHDSWRATAFLKAKSGCKLQPVAILWPGSHHYRNWRRMLSFLPTGPSKEHSQSEPSTRAATWYADATIGYESQYENLCENICRITCGDVDVGLSARG